MLPDLFEALLTGAGLNAPDGVGCSLTGGELNAYIRMLGSKCTWWCWVLPDWKQETGRTRIFARLNAPDGAGCSLTGLIDSGDIRAIRLSQCT